MCAARTAVVYHWSAPLVHHGGFARRFGLVAYQWYVTVRPAHLLCQWSAPVVRQGGFAGWFRLVAYQWYAVKRRLAGSAG